MDATYDLAACPDFLSIGSMLKAHPSEEAGKRIVYFEASNEGLDAQGEVVAAKALSESADYYLRYGNVDLDHYSRIGARLGIPDYSLYEVGQPREVKQRGNATFVKSEIFTGSGKAADKANMLWASLTEVHPPQRWYPSVGGAVLAKAIEIDPETKEPKTIITKVRWSNIGLSHQPVNQHVGVCATMPIGVFAKCMTATGLDINKALEAGYGTDSATLTGGGSLRKQSLAGAKGHTGPISYWSMRDDLAKAMSTRALGSNPTSADLVAHAVKTFGISQDEAAEHVGRFMSDLRDGMNQRKAS